MAMTSDCPACFSGDHDHHVEHWGVRPEGVIDGDFCHCTGDCAARSKANFEKWMGGPFFNSALSKPTPQAVLKMLEELDVITTHPDSKDKCCGMARDKYGRCQHRPYHPIHVEYE